jgi:hypothetical protein
VTVALLPVGQRDDAAQRYIDTRGSASSRRTSTSHCEQAGRALLGWRPGARPTRIGARTLHLAVERVPWSSVTPDDCQRVRAQLLEQREPRTAGAICGALRGVLRAAGVLTVQHLDALRIEHQQTSGRMVEDVVAEWDDESPLAPESSIAPTDAPADAV